VLKRWTHRLAWAAKVQFLNLPTLFGGSSHILAPARFRIGDKGAVQWHEAPDYLLETWMSELFQWNYVHRANSDVFAEFADDPTKIEKPSARGVQNLPNLFSEVRLACGDDSVRVLRVERGEPFWLPAHSQKQRGGGSIRSEQIRDNPKVLKDFVPVRWGACAVRV
jgi:hypothetical protein